jgi:predicted component of type VI protein secretion system
LEKRGLLKLDQLELVFETGLLVDIPGNAQPVAINLAEVEKEVERVDVFLHLLSEPETVKGSWSDGEGSFVELRQQKLMLVTTRERTPQPGFPLLRLIRKKAAEDQRPGPDRAVSGWLVDTTYLPPLLTLSAWPGLQERCFGKLSERLLLWKTFLRRQARENSLAVHKRVEARECLRRAYSLEWLLRQMDPHVALSANNSNITEAGAEPFEVVPLEDASAVRLHPYDFFRRLVEFYLDVFAFRCSEEQMAEQQDPITVLYQHENLATCLRKLELLIDENLVRPGPGSPDREFFVEPGGERMVCALPPGLEPQTQVYWLVQFEERAEGAGAQSAKTADNDVDLRLLGIKLAAPERLTLVEQRVLPGIPIERVRLLPFPHDFDSNTVQFYRLGRGAEWSAAYKAGAVAFERGRRRMRAFLYWPESAPVVMERAAPR